MKRKSRMPGGVMGLVESKVKREANERSWKSSWWGRFLDSLLEALFGGLSGGKMELTSDRRKDNPLFSRLSEKQTRETMARRMKRVFRAGNRQQGDQQPRLRRSQLRRR